jgi:hypothetical protein
LDFARVSGLKVNFDKCILIPVGTGNDTPGYFFEMGFKVDNKATILGVTISNNTNDLKDNFNIVCEKILHLRNFWARFNLSLPGRLAVAKTLMLSRLGYLGAFLDPDQAQLTEIKKLIYGFVKGKLNVSNDRVTATVSLGGLGMIDIDDYLIALKCSWIRRAGINKDDLWSYCLDRLNFTNLDGRKLPVLDPEWFPVLSGIAEACKKFCLASLRLDNNILESKVYGNMLFCNNLPVPEQGVNFIERQILNSLWLKDILNEGSLYPLVELNNRLGVELNLDNYNILVRGVREIKAKKILLPVNTYPVKPATLVSILNKPKKGSKLYRKYLARLKYGNKPLNRNTLKKFNALVGNGIMDPIKESHFLNTRWRLFGMSNKLSEFAFKMTNNLLGLNSRVHHFNRFVDEGCTFCALNNLLPVPRETFIHLFFDCPETAKTLMSFENEYLQELNLNTVTERKKFWFLSLHVDVVVNKNTFLNLTTLVILFYVWECKLQKKRQSFGSALNYFFYHMDIIRKISSQTRTEMTKLNLDLCRYWNGERRRGW